MARGRLEKVWKLRLKLLILKLFLTLLIVAFAALPILSPTFTSGFVEELEVLGIGGAIAVFCIFLVLVFFYCQDLKAIFELVAPENRAATPNSVWYMFLMPYNFVEDFFIVKNVSDSIRAESTTNHALREVKYFGIYSGIGWCSAQILSFAPGYVGKVASLVALVLWVIHWRYVRRIINLLRSQRAHDKLV